MRKDLVQTPLALIAALLLSSFCRSQQPDAQLTTREATTGNVMGTIYGSDTNAPIRHGQLTLVPIHGPGRFSEQLISNIDVEGRFSFRRVPAGKYYVSAHVGGYLNPLPGSMELHLDSVAKDERSELKKRAVEVDVDADGTVNLALRLDRAAEIDGTVVFDDGSPGFGLLLKIEAKNMVPAHRANEIEHDNNWDYLDSYSPGTDDRGQFRIIGLRPGFYLLSVSLSTLMSERQGDYLLAQGQDAVAAFGRLTVFYGEGFRAMDAKVIHVHEGETVTGVDITIPLSKLHRVSGNLTRKSTGQPPPAALVRVLYADTKEEARSAFAVDGEFQISYLPEGSYILEAEPLRREIPEGEDAVQFYRSREKLFPDPDTAPVAQLPILLTGDMSGVTIAIPDVPVAQVPATN